MVGFLIGLTLGSLAGFFVAALMAAAGRGDELERIEYLERRLREQREGKPNGHTV